MAKEKFPATPAIRELKRSGCPYSLHQYDYEEKGGTERAASELNVDEHTVLKTLIMEDHTGEPMVILMHGDKKVSTKNLARFLNVKTVKPCDPDTARQHSGYLVGGTSPLGLKKPLRVYMEQSIVQLPSIFVNAGKRGLLAKMSAQDLTNIIKPVFVTVAQ